MEGIERVKKMAGPEDFYEKFIDAINITITSYGFVINLFPIQSQMKDKRQSSVLLAVLLALVFCVFSYSLLTKLAINIYGEQNIQQSIFDNLKQDSGLLSVGIRGIFLIIFICNIPYLFYPGKLSVLNILQEYRFRCFSKSLERATNLDQEPGNLQNDLSGDISRSDGSMITVPLID
jgi:amino acid permease